MIAYLRVSTQRQGQSGLGLDAQRSAIAAFSARRGAPVDLEMIEVETGTAKKDRPVLAMAIAEARARKVPIVTAKLDRLARDVSTICAIREAGVAFIALDLPETENPLFMFVIAALAEYEAKLISERTKAALNAKRSKGWKPVSNHTFSDLDARRGHLAQWSRAVAREQKMAAHAEALLMAGNSVAKVTKALNAEGYLNQAGRPLTEKQVKRAIMRRLEAQGRGLPEDAKNTRRRQRLHERILAANIRQEIAREAKNGKAKEKRI